MRGLIAGLEQGFNSAAKDTGEELKGNSGGAVDVYLQLQKSCKSPIDYACIKMVECLQLI